jgi:two-component system CheB/CheR fusion protein
MRDRAPNSSPERKRAKKAARTTRTTPGKALSADKRVASQGQARSRTKRSRRGEPRANGRKPAAQAPPGDPLAAAHEGAAFPVVGIGASAGGLEALEQFLRHVPKEAGLAFVVVQHLDPTHKGIMVELLQRTTPMPVIQVRDRLKVEPDRVYVIPPNKDMSILHGVLHLLPPVAPRGLNLPIDYFFRSLAEDQQERSIGVVLSGMGSDGTLGLRAIKEKAGASFVQAPSSAKFDGMPKSAIDAGLADVVAPVEELPGKIVAYRQHAPYIARPNVPLEEKAQSALEKVFILLRNHTGNDFSAYKKSTIYRRIERRMGLHQLDKIANYVRYLRENPNEIDLLFKELLIGVTSFFRDPPAWEHLGREVLPRLFSERADGAVLRAWVPGCSTGEEAYSLAVVFKEALELLRPAGKSIGLQIFATDLDKDAVEVARVGLYPANIAADVSPERLRRFFVHEERGYRVGKEIREMVVFAPQNVAMDPPFTKLDLVSCRNLLIYLSAELQKRLIPLFHYSLNPGGILFLGSAETIGTFTGLFAPLNDKARTYRRLVTAGGAPIEFPSTFGATLPDRLEQGTLPAGPMPPPNLQALANLTLVQRFSPPGVLCSDKGDILYVSGRTGKYLEPATGKANLNIFAMAREGLRYELSTAFSAAQRETRAITVRGLTVGTNGGAQTINLTVERLAQPEALRGTVLIVFGDVPAPVAPAEPKEAHPLTVGHGRPGKMQQQLQRARVEAQSIREQMQTSQEELKSTNEELQSTNEELQSTNEELTTSKEEMQSLNEELQTVNHELQSKVNELSRSNNDMKNLLNSTDIATLFLDAELRVRRFTTQTAKIVKLIPTDTGRLITDITSELDYPGLANDAREVLKTLVFQEKVVPARGGHWFTVRILPYRTLDNVIDGVVITFTDATAAKALETTLRDQASQLTQMAESLPSLVWGARPDGACDYVSHQWVEYTGISESEQLGHGWLEQLHPEDRERTRESWRATIRDGTPLNVEFRIRAKDGEHRWFKARSVPIRGPHGAILRWYGINTDVEDLKQGESAREQAFAKLASILDGISDAFLALDSSLTITFFNAAAERLLQRSRGEVLGKALWEVLPEARGSILEEKCRQAVREQEPSTFEAQLETSPYRGRYGVRLYPHATSILLVLPGSAERPVARAPAGGDSGDAHEEAQDHSS